MELLLPYKRRNKLLLILFLTALIAGHAQAQQRVCTLDLAVARSSLSLNGQLTKPINQKINPLASSSASGFVSVVLPTDACPSAAGLEKSLEGAWLVAPSGRRGVSFEPLRASAIGVGGLSVDLLQGALISTDPAASGVVPIAFIPTSGSANLGAGPSGPAPVPLSGRPLAGSGCTLRTASGADGVVSLSCHGLRLSWQLEGSYGPSADLEVTGDLEAAGRLSDALVLPAPAAIAQRLQQQRPGLRLEAGSGLPLPAAGRQQQQQQQSKDAVTEAAATQARAARCRPGFPVPADGNCTCADGWRGRDCFTCSRDSVCPGFTGRAGSTCDTHMAYSGESNYKAYDCDLVGGLSKWVTGVTALCNVRGAPLPFKDYILGLQPGGMASSGDFGGPYSSPFCKLDVGLVAQPKNPLSCLVSKCTFTAGSPTFSCLATNCSCGAGRRCPPLIQGVVSNLGNSTIGLTCDPSDSGKCILDGITPRFSLQCRSGECTAPPTSQSRGAAAAGSAPAEPPPKAFPMIALISALPIVLLLVLGLVFLSYVLASRQLFVAGAPAPPPPAATSDPKVVTLLAPQPSITLPTGNPDPTTAFIFDSIVCSVPERSDGAAAAPAAGAAPGDASRGLPHGGGFGSLLRRRGADATAAAATDLSLAGAGRPRGAEERPGRKVLLHGISGAVDEGEVLGVMGPSGSGKSTLLSILSGAVESVGAGARVEGSVTLGGERRRGVLRKVTAFVPQRDVLLPALTVEECVRYSALLRLPEFLTAAEIQDRIDGVLAELGLSHVAGSLVGGSASIRGVSGGERRRVTIAMALVTRPRLVIMDEPTSGLDSYTAYNLMRTAQEIAMHDRVVIMSLHQPSPDMFDSLSQVLLLAKGRLIYLGAPSSVAPYFSAAGLPVPRKRQPAEHMLHVASQPAGLAALLQYLDKCSDARRRTLGAAQPAAPQPAAGPHGAGAAHGAPPLQPQHAHVVPAAAAGPFGSAMALARLASGSHASSLPSGVSVSSLMLNVHADVAKGSSTSSSNGDGASPTSADDTGSSGGPAGHGHGHGHNHSRGGGASRGRHAGLRGWARGKARECAVLYWRAFTNMRREPRLLMLHIAVALVLGLVVGAVFFHLESTQVGVQNRLGSMFFALALFGWTSVSVVDGLVLERELVEREVAGHYYRGGTYLLSSLVLDGLLLRTLPALLFSALMYPMVGLLPEVSRVITFMFVLATYTCTVGALTTALTALCRTSSATTLTMNIVLLMWVLVGGYLVNPSSIPVWLRWIRCLSPMSFAFEVLAANEMADQVYSLQVPGLANLDGIKGDVFLRTLGLTPSRATESAVALACFYVGSVALAFAATSYTLWRHAGGSFARALRRPFVWAFRRSEE